MKILELLWSFAGGMLLGMGFFGGLWLTVKKVPQASAPALLVLVSFLLRMALVITGFFWLSAGDPWRLALTLAGFLLIRQLWLHRIQPRDSVRSSHQSSSMRKGTS